MDKVVTDRCLGEGRTGAGAEWREVELGDRRDGTPFAIRVPTPQYQYPSCQLHLLLCENRITSVWSGVESLERTHHFECW